MLLRSEIEDVFHAQQKALKKELLTSRNYLVENTFKGKQVEVISGIRRSGKSTLMRMIMAHYAPNVICFNFEDSRIFGFEVSDFKKLDELMGETHPVYFFDEIAEQKNNIRYFKIPFMCINFINFIKNFFLKFLF